MSLTEAALEDAIDTSDLKLHRAAVEAAEAPGDAATVPQPASRDDVALLDRLRAGDEDAFASLVDLYHGRLIRLAMSFVSDRGAAEEVVQDTWLGVMNGLAGFEGRSSLKTWIFRILVHRARTRGARDARMVPFSALGAPEDGESAREPAVDPSAFTPDGAWAAHAAGRAFENPERALLRREILGALEVALAELPAAQRAVVTLRDVEGCAAAAACNVLGVSETNQRVLLHRGRAKLRRALERHLDGKC